MKKHEPRQIVHKEWAAIETTVQQLQLQVTEEALHHFRVGVKKLRSLLQLANLPLPGKIKKAYAAAGKLRNLQLHRKNLGQHFKSEAIPAGYQDFLENELVYRENEFTRLVQHKKLLKGKKKLFGALPPAFTQKQWNLWLQKKKQRLHTMLQQPKNDDAALHQLRKLLKGLLFLEETGAGMQPRSSVLKKQKTIAGELGDYMDISASLFLLQQYLRGNQQPGENEKLAAMAAQLTDQKKAVKNTIVLQLSKPVV